MAGYFSDIWRLRYFWMALVRNDLRTRYRRSVIGIGWSLLHPIAMTVVLCAVFSQLFGAPLREYAPILLSGLTFWAFITTTVMDGCQCFFRGESYIRQHPAPLAIYPLRTTLGAGFHFILGFGIAVGFVWIVNGFGNVPAMLSLIPTFMLLFVIGWAMALCMGVMNVLFQDVEHLIQVLMQVMFYLTPIMYPPEMLTDRLDRMNLAWLMHLNPFAVLLGMIREPLLYGRLPSSTLCLIGALFGLITVGIASLVMRRFEKRLIFYL